jgi:predicted  nucleic acid-binding Zn-ribbon protein
VAKQLQDLEREVATLRRRQSELEDSELEVMERAETAQAELDRLTEQRSGHAEARAAAEARRDAALVELDAELQRTTTERAQVAGSLPEDLLALYTRLRASEGGVGAGEISRGRCGGCRLDLMNNEKSEIRAARRTRCCCTRSAAGSWSVRPSPASRSWERVGGWSSKRTAARGATPVRPATGRWCGTP